MGKRVDNEDRSTTVTTMAHSSTGVVAMLCSMLIGAMAQAGTTSPDDRAAARQLVREGDRAYRRHDYARAATAYANAYPNAPLAYAHVMAGDAHWRDVLQAQAAAAAARQTACPLDNRYFPRDLSLGLAQEQRRGLALADPALRASWWYLRARRSTDCLQAVAERVAQQPAEACADLAGVKTCLGPPLPTR